MTEPDYYGEQGAPLVVVIHDWYGRLPWLENVARSLVAEGLQVAIPDFLGGRTSTDSDEARSFIESMDIGAALAVIDDIVDEARLYGTTKVGELGFSTGGWLALVHAQGGGADAVAAYYATLTEEHHGLIPCPVLLQYAESDSWEFGDDPDSFYRRLEEHGTTATHYSYPGTLHHFANANVTEFADPHASAIALARTSAFFAAHLLD